MHRRVILCVMIIMVLMLAMYLKVIHQESGMSNYLAYLSQQSMRSITYIYLAMAAGTLISAGQVDISPAAILNLFGMVAIYLSNITEGECTVSIIAIVIFPIIMAIYCTYAIVLIKWPLLSALIVTLGSFFVLKGGGEFLQIAMQGAGPLSELINPINVPRLHVAPLPNGRFESFVVSNPIFHVIGLAVSICVMHWWRYRTRFGLQHVALGENALAATRVGVDREQVIKIAFFMAGALVFLGWLNEFFVVRLTSWNIQGANGYELLAIAAAVIGGARIEGGRFDPLSAALAAVFVKLVESITPLSDLPSEMGFLCIGISLVIASLSDGVRQSKVEKQAKTLLWYTNS